MHCDEDASISTANENEPHVIQKAIAKSGLRARWLCRLCREGIRRHAYIAQSPQEHNANMKWRFRLSFRRSLIKMMSFSIKSN